jgi:transketolase
LDFGLKCREFRYNILVELATLGVGHSGGSLSIVELLVMLYYKHMNVEAGNPKMQGRDRLIVSKGHSGPAVYAVLCDKGYFSKDWLKTLNAPGTNLPSHCDMNRTPGVDMTTGSLGQGFSCAAGIALGSKLRRDNAKIYTVIGDGESQEGQIWETAMFAAQHKLDNLIGCVDDNKMQLDGKTADICNVEPLDKKWEAFGWNVISVENGNDCSWVDSALTKAKVIKNGKPTMVIFHTVKGFGLSFAREAGVANHSMPISKEMFGQGLEELGFAL